MAAARPLGYVTQTSAVSSAPPQVVYETISDLRNHLDWSGERASSQTFKLDRKRGKPWDAHFIHRYDVAPEGEGSRITYTETIERVNYVPYWLQPGVRSIFKVYVNRADRKQLENLARLAEERAAR